MAIFGSLGDIDVGVISKVISDTAVDVFVYDTSKDSDGGAWRKRTQHTSWYNETLNTATRGSRRDFPAVAVIVVEALKVTIYDGDDPDLPMWMVFTDRSYAGMLFESNATCVHALNAKVSCGSATRTAAGYDLYVIDFISDSGVSYSDSSIISGTFKFPISGRNPATFSQPSDIWTFGTVPNIISRQINDVAMTVLPNAPIDPSTGLPIPTIAVATSGGASVIKDDGTVANIGGTITTKIDINQKLIFTASTANGGYYGFTVDGFSSINAFFNTVGNLRILSNVNSNTNNNLVVPNSSNLYSGQTVGLSLVYKNGLDNSDYNGMVSYITTSYNTGWMHGDIKGAWLSDTSTASVTGIELNQYGDFSSTTGWGSRTAAWTISGGVASVSSGAGFQLLGTTSGTLTNGRRYAITVNVTAFTAGRLEISQANSSNIQFNLSSTGFKSLIFTYTGTTGQSLGIYGYGDASYAFTIDNLYVRELSEADRSVSNTGLAVYGTIPKTPVATGADLVSYSGFNASNGLIQPYNSGFDFGTGDYYMSVWAYGGSTDQALMIREEPQGDANGAILIFQYNGYYAFYSRTNGTSTWTTFLSTAPYGNYWSHIYLVRRSGILQGYVNGNLVGSTAFSGSVSNGNAQLSIGKRIPGVNTQYFTGQLALAKIGAGAPSPEQIRKIYNDEKALFQENSKAVLFGSSDAVTALAYDDTTKLLHVGTSSGRSDFQGLERINNTTTAVTTAISASNGLIAEQ